jgi:hypothetical protein
VSTPADPSACYFLHKDPKTEELTKARYDVQIKSDHGTEIKPMCSGHKQATCLRQDQNFNNTQRKCDPERVKEITAAVKDPRTKIRAEPLPDRRVSPSAPLPKPIRPRRDPSQPGYDGGRLQPGSESQFSDTGPRGQSGGVVFASSACRFRLATSRAIPSGSY